MADKPPAARLMKPKGLFEGAAVMRVFSCEVHGRKAATRRGQLAVLYLAWLSCACANAATACHMLRVRCWIAMRSASASVSLGRKGVTGPAGACAEGSGIEGIGAAGAGACCDRAAHGDTANNKNMQVTARGKSALYVMLIKYRLPPGQPRSWLRPAHGSPGKTGWNEKHGDDNG